MRRQKTKGIMLLLADHAMVHVRTELVLSVRKEFDPNITKRPLRMVVSSLYVEPFT